MHTNLVKVLTGQRRVGKSYLLFQIMQEVSQLTNSNIIYLNKEDITFSDIKKSDDLNRFVQNNKKAGYKNYVFIDEIQEIEGFETTLRSLILDDSFDVYCTGSNANMMSADIAGYLSGRYIEVKVYSLSYPEFLVFHSLENQDESLEYYLKYGGMPYLHQLPLRDEIVFEYLKNIYNTIVYRDIINKFEVRNVPFLERLVQFLASSTGSIFSAKRISDYLKSQNIRMSPNQVQIYIGYLINAFIIQPVRRFDLQGKRIFEVGEKYYFENTGIRNALWGYRLEDRSKLVENVVYNYLSFQGFDVYVGALDSREIDFVAKKNGEILYLQVAFKLTGEQTIAREFGNLLAISDNYKKMVITLDKYSGNTVQGIQIVQLKEFLSEEISIR